MSFAGTLCLVLVAEYGLASLLLSILVAVLWRAGIERACSAADDLLALRLLPSAGAAFLTLAIVLPAFLLYEPHHAVEQVGRLLMLLVIFALLILGNGIRRGWRACMASTTLLRKHVATEHCRVIAGRYLHIVDFPELLVAVVGAWRPRIVVASEALAVCSDEELHQVIAHEAAHISAHDNLKLLLMLASPDALAWLPVGKAVTARWRSAAEVEADAAAAGSDRHKRVALASALVKMARLSSGAKQPLNGLTMPIAGDDVEGRVRRLLTPLSTLPGTLYRKIMLVGALLIAVLVGPLYGMIQEFAEALVSSWR